MKKIVIFSVILLLTMSGYAYTERNMGSGINN